MTPQERRAWWELCLEAGEFYQNLLWDDGILLVLGPSRQLAKMRWLFIQGSWLFASADPTLKARQDAYAAILSYRIPAMMTALVRELERNRKRARAKERARSAARPEECDPLYHPLDVESMVISQIDWDRGKQVCGLSGDQQKALEARLEGLNLQGAGAPDYLGWPGIYLDAVRRSLAPDRPTGQALRRYFRSYNSRESDGSHG